MSFQDSFQSQAAQLLWICPTVSPEVVALALHGAAVNHISTLSSD